MNSTSWIWRITSTISIAATLLLLYGFISAVAGMTSSSPATSLAELPESGQSSAPAAGPNRSENEVNAVAIGDSLARGTGDDSGSGFVRRFVDLLDKKGGMDAKLINNLGINGLTTEALLTKLDEPGVQYVLREANVIMLSIGGNDLFAGGQAVLGGSEPPTVEELTAALPAASLRLQKILDRLHTINPAARILVLGLYNPFSDLPEMKIPGNTVVSEWNQAALKITNKTDNMSVIPTFDLFEQNLEVYLSSDHFHPNGAGYEAIAERIVQGFGTASPGGEADK
ncbi:GDSL-type esterase/lipase family protein [Paenibacillus sp. P96]|uniref:GDSL-type esterase/lipase family protein n=1 Tax=Paenibacillus zeirhizosphaerae TaxID=2987519 RepID=A0ABT9FPF6_9BACL|nr:GDSL-type esterase/lipase family protein [Paenibacillus sp. P96]MDP4096564.1 GDSL-type esterase/lipase family protein [Paenibacillus sp. P96]